MIDKNGSSTPSPKPVEGRPIYELPPVATVSDSPISSAPSTPNDEAGQKRTDSPVTIGNEDYFMTALRLRQDSKSAPGTPSGQSKRNATFSPRLIFYDTWTGQEYDRRSELATCNRLTPMLAQQIKEELNTFKMVCILLIFYGLVMWNANLRIRKWKCTRAPRSTPISSDNDSLRWCVYQLRALARLVPKPHRVSAILNGVYGIASYGVEAFKWQTTSCATIYYDT